MHVTFFSFKSFFEQLTLITVSIKTEFFSYTARFPHAFIYSGLKCFRKLIGFERQTVRQMFFKSTKKKLRAVKVKKTKFHQVAQNVRSFKRQFLKHWKKKNQCRTSESHWIFTSSAQRTYKTANDILESFQRFSLRWQQIFIMIAWLYSEGPYQEHFKF